MLIADALFILTTLELRATQPEYTRLRKMTLLAIGCGLIGFISGALY